MFLKYNPVWGLKNLCGQILCYERVKARMAEISFYTADKGNELKTEFS
jgi:hypothetical protein